MERFEGRRVLVTGSSRGIGAALAEGFLRQGAQVIVNGRDAATVDAAVARLAAAAPEHAERVEAAVFDVTDDRAVDAAAERIGRLDVLVNNAGVQIRGPILEMPTSTWRAVVETNLTGALVVGRAFGRAMVEAGSGSVINICSVQSSIVRPTTSPYAAAKAGLVGLTRSMCAEWAPAGVRVNAIAPGYIATELNSALTADAEFSSWIEGRTPARRWGTEADLVGPTLWLASDDAAFVNGQTIYVDGGMTAVI